MGPRTEEELPAACQVEALLQRLRETLVCRKVEKTAPHQLITCCCSTLFSTRSSVCLLAQFSTVVSEQMLLSSTVSLACKLGKDQQSLTLSVQRPAAQNFLCLSSVGRAAAGVRLGARRWTRRGTRFWVGGSCQSSTGAAGGAVGKGLLFFCPAPPALRSSHRHSGPERQ